MSDNSCSLQMMMSDNSCSLAWQCLIIVAPLQMTMPDSLSLHLILVASMAGSVHHCLIISPRRTVYVRVHQGNCLEPDLQFQRLPSGGFSFLLTLPRPVIFNLTFCIHPPGNPGKPGFHSKVLNTGRDSYKLSWITTSYEAILEYRLLYRKLPVSIPIYFFLQIAKQT